MNIRPLLLTLLLAACSAPVVHVATSPVNPTAKNNTLNGPIDEDPVAMTAAGKLKTGTQTAPMKRRFEDPPETIAAAVARLPAVLVGPFTPSWESIRTHYTDPDWLRDAKFGIMMHWGLYSVPAHGSEWYVRYMYDRKNTGFVKWHTEHYGPPEKFGYKDFIPLFTAEKWDPDAWAALFKEAGAGYVLSSGEHHDGFSNWDSAINPYNAKAMGPKRDLVGELTAAVRKVGLKTGVANHSNIHFDFVTPLLGSDQFDPAWSAFYSVADRSEQARVKFLETWVTKNMELIDKYQPDMLWFDMNGSDRTWDPLKLRLAAYYFNRAAAWKKQVAISAKGESFLAGMVMDYERQGRAPKVLTDFIWQPDDPIADKFGYVEGLPLKSAGSLVHNLVINVSRNGGLLLNISPKADGTIPDNQQQVLRSIGAWLHVNGDAIYGTRPWKIAEEGRVHFTTKGNALYAIALDWPAGELLISALGERRSPAGKIARVELLGHPGELTFTQDAAGLHVSFPSVKPNDFAYALRITGLKLKMPDDILAKP